jgi:hypothetical protein
MNFRLSVQALVVLGLIFLLSACAATPPAAPPSAETPSAPEPATGPASEIVVYASDLPAEALSELDLMDDSASPGGKMISLPNNGDELDPPPENDPHITFNVPVQSGVPYRCWVHMKVGEPKGRSTANVVWVQFSDSVNQAGQEVYRPGTRSYLTAQGPSQLGWTWVGCDAADGSDSLVYFQNSGEVTVRIQAGAEGVGVDQFVLSPSAFLNAPPAEPIVPK